MLYQKMKHLRGLALACFLLACTGSSEKLTPENGNLENLLTKFKEVSIDTFEVFSANDLDNTNYKFKGVELDSSDVMLLPNKMAERYSYDHGFYACFKFPIDSSRFGLIIRTPSEYDASSVKLFVLDTVSKKINDDYLELAESIGDAGYSMERRSWILKSGDSNLTFLIWQQDSEDKSVEDENDTTVVSTDYVTLTRLSKQSFDTLSNDSEKLIKKFEKLIKD